MWQGRDSLIHSNDLMFACWIIHGHVHSPISFLFAVFPVIRRMDVKHSNRGSFLEMGGIIQYIQVCGVSYCRHRAMGSLYRLVAKRQSIPQEYSPDSYIRHGRPRPSIICDPLFSQSSTL